MRFIYLIFIFSCPVSSAMDPYTQSLETEYKKISLGQAKKEIDKWIGLDRSFKVEILIKLFGAQLTQEEKDEFLFSSYARPNITPLLLAIGANANMHHECKCIKSAWSGFPNHCKKESILHWAARFGNPGVVKALLEYGAIVDPRDTQDETPLMKACRISATNYSRGDKRYLIHYIQVINHLMSARADKTLKNKAGKTALQIAQTEITDLHEREIIVAHLTCYKIL